MIPEKLTIKGIYSYQQSVTIDFENLISAGIFGIFGSVGSGKSTILEAISYALYGETERLNNRDSKLYNMMNLRSDEMEIDFVMKHQNVRYRFTTYARRNSKQFEDISKSERKAYQEKSGQWIPLESADATNITGLKYEHFKQIVIIPQGKFNEFVQLSSADRTKMLRELFPLDRFDLKDPVSKLFSAAKTAITSLEGRLHELEEYQPERVEILKKEIRERKSNLGKLKLLLQEKEKERSNAIELKEMLNEFHKAQVKWNQLNDQKSHYEQLKQRIEKFEKTRLTYGHLLGKWNDLDSDLSQNAKRSQKLSKEKEQITLRKFAHEELISQIKKQIGDVDTHRNQLDEMSTAIKIKAIDENLGAINKTVLRLEVNLKEEEQKQKTLKQKTQDLKIALNDLKKGLSSESQIYQLQRSYVEEDNLMERLTSAELELKKVESLIAELTEERTNIVSAVFAELETDQNVNELKMSEAIELIESAIKRIDNEVALNEHQKDELSAKSRIAVHAKELKEGEKCPLCGSLEHPEPYVDEKIAVEREQVQKMIENQRAVKELLTKSLTKLAGLKKRFQQEGSQVNERKQQLESIQMALKECIAKQKEIPLLLSREALNVSLKNLELLKQKISKLEKEIQNAEEELNNQDKLSELKEHLDQQKDQGSQLIGQKKALQTEANEKWLTYTKGQIEERTKQVKVSLDKLQNVTNDLTELEKLFDRVAIELSQNEKSQSDLNQKKIELQSQIDIQLAKNNFSTVDEVRQVLTDELDIEQSKIEIESFTKELHLFDNKMTELKAKVGEQTFDEENLKELDAAYKTLKLQISQHDEQLGALQNELDQLNKKLTIKTELKKELTSLEKRKSNLEVLSRLLRGDGFVKYVSQIYLQQLCAIGNERFKKLTQNQLELDIDEKYNFIIRDYLHEGKTRLLKTLSGGQTFQAALSLAMALSEQIQQYQNVKQQFFFMDEGFGSLDKESLSLVFDTLKQLRKEERTVGIISHLEELQTEIDHAIFVENDVEEGSSIKFSG